MRVPVLAVVIALAVGGCGGPDARPAADTASPSPSAPVTIAPISPTPSAKATVTRLTVTQAKVRYLKVTRPYNVALESFETAANGGAGVATLRHRASTVAAANLVESRALAATAWPDSITEQVAQLVKIDGTTRRLWLQVAHAESLSEMSGLLRRISAAGDKSPSALIRKRLGLPKYDEKDYQ
jgi:hypothetical protein